MPMSQVRNLKSKARLVEEDRKKKIVRGNFVHFRVFSMIFLVYRHQPPRSYAASFSKSEMEALALEDLALLKASATVRNFSMYSSPRRARSCMRRARSHVPASRDSRAPPKVACSRAGLRYCPRPW